MRRVKAEELSYESFSPFGSFFNPEDCGVPLGSDVGPVKFHPDRLIQLFEYSNMAAISCLVIEPRELVVNVTEIHLHTEEVFGGFTKDVFFHVGPAGSSEPDLSQFKVFRLPAGWWARIKRGVWHHAPFISGNESTFGIVVLPPATYTADCFVVDVVDGMAVEV